MAAATSNHRFHIDLHLSQGVHQQNSICSIGHKENGIGFDSLDFDHHRRNVRCCRRIRLIQYNLHASLFQQWCPSLRRRLTPVRVLVNQSNVFNGVYFAHCL